jgi:hypothetical protein
MAGRATWIALLVILVFPALAPARTWNVRKDGSGDYTVIQDAVDHAAAGDTVRIGPGRFEEKRPFTSYPIDTAEKWTFDVFVAVTVSDLTIIGSGADQTIIGWPTTLGGGPDQPKVICALSRNQRLVVEDLALENVFQGVYRSPRGSLTMRRCRTSGCESGVCTESDLYTTLESIRFEDLAIGLSAFAPAQAVSVVDCVFAECRATFSGASQVVVTDCAFEGSVVGCQYASGSTGMIVNSTFTNHANFAIVALTGSVLELYGNRVSGGSGNLRARTVATVTGWGNSFGGGTLRTIDISGADVRLHGCEILNNGGLTVYLDTFQNPPVQTLDLTDNYWGTSSADTIAQWIYDVNDNPSVYARVLYEPFRGQPVTTESTSWGDLKASFR